MPDDDMPPERMWLDDEELSNHFKKVREKYSKNGSSSDSSYEVPDLAQNDLTREVKGR